MSSDCITQKPCPCLDKPDHRSLY